MLAQVEKNEFVERDTNRLVYLDNIRIFLTALVIIHHVAITYGSKGSWYYFEHSNNSTLNDILSFFTGLNQMYFMGFFFLIAGYFTLPSYDRKGAAFFLRDRFIRLGIPLLLYIFTINPVLEYVKCITTEKLNITFWEFYNYNTLHLRNIPTGVMWFVEALLILSCIYTFFRFMTGKIKLKYEINLNLKIISIFVILLSAFTFITRLYFPMGVEVNNFQIAYFPQYICMFTFGIIANRFNWFSKIPYAISKTGIIIAISSVAFVEITNALTKVFSNPTLVGGGLHWQSLVVSIYQAIFCTSMCLSILVLFRNKFNKQRDLARIFSRNSYAIYIIHAPVVVILAYLMRSTTSNSLIKFSIVSAMGISICFLISHFIIFRIPFTKKVL